MAELNPNQIQNNQMDQKLCEKFILPWKLVNSTINTTVYTCSTESLF